MDGGHLFGGVLDNLCDFCVIYGELVAYRDFRAGCGVATDPVAMPADANALIFLLETQRQALAVAYALHPQSRIIFICRTMVLKRMVASLRAERIRA